MPRSDCYTQAVAPEHDPPRAKAIATFCVALVTGALLRPILRLSAVSLVPVREGMLTPSLWAVTIAWMVFQAYAEGYRGFQLRFCPRVMARAAYLGRHPRRLHLLLALPFCLSLFYGPPKKLVARYVFLILLISLIVAVRMLPQPWLGIIDAGVVLGLVWGVISLWWLLARYLLGYGAPAPTDLPEEVDPLVLADDGPRLVT